MNRILNPFYIIVNFGRRDPEKQLYIFSPELWREGESAFQNYQHLLCTSSNFPHQLWPFLFLWKFSASRALISRSIIYFLKHASLELLFINCNGVSPLNKEHIKHHLLIMKILFSIVLQRKWCDQCCLWWWNISIC